MVRSSLPASFPMAPAPIQTLVLDCEIGGESYAGVYRVWRTAQARGCGLCHRCTAIHADAEGISSCAIPIRGGLADRSRAPLVGVAADGRITFGDDLGDGVR